MGLETGATRALKRCASNTTITILIALLIFRCTAPKKGQRNQRTPDARRQIEGTTTAAKRNARRMRRVVNRRNAGPMIVRERCGPRLFGIAWMEHLRECTTGPDMALQNGGFQSQMHGLTANLTFFLQSTRTAPIAVGRVATRFEVNT
jgi:hypothetical protein